MPTDVFLRDGCEMGELIRSKNWSNTPLGNPHQWPMSLQLHTKTILDNKLGAYIAWGLEYTQIFNDTFRPILGSKHPLALGSSSKETFSEIWHIIGPMFDEVMKGKSVGFTDFMVPLDRNEDGKPEECFFDFSYSPIYHEAGYVGGVLVTVIETTDKVQSLKRLLHSQSNLRNLVINAQVGMCLLKGDNYVVEEANDAMLRLWGTSREVVMGRPIFEALPIGKDQNIQPHLDQVYKTGISYYGKNSLIANSDGELHKVYVN